MSPLPVDRPGMHHKGILLCSRQVAKIQPEKPGSLQWRISMLSVSPSGCEAPSPSALNCLLKLERCVSIFSIPGHQGCRCVYTRGSHLAKADYITSGHPAMHDISNDSHLQTFKRLCLSYGIHVQKSLGECSCIRLQHYHRGSDVLCQKVQAQAGNGASLRCRYPSRPGFSRYR